MPITVPEIEIYIHVMVDSLVYKLPGPLRVIFLWCMG